MTTTPDPAITEQVQRVMAEERLRVTRLDTEALSGKIGTVNTKLNVLLGAIGLAIGLLMATYGATAFFTWRLFDKLIGS